MTEYCAGFLFDLDLRRVALVKKSKPAWMKDKWNAIGGHVEPGETPVQAMRREFLEEAGLDVSDWRRFATLNAGDSIIHFFYTHQDHDKVRRLNEVSDTGEPIRTFDVVNLLNIPRIVNLSWLIPMAVYMGSERADSFQITEEVAA